MKYTFSIHGVPYGSQSWGDISDSEYIKSFYNSVSASNVPTQMIVDIRYSGNTICSYYHYLRLSNVDDFESRPGSYFGMTICFEGVYCSDFVELYKLLNACFNKVAINTVLIKSGERYKYALSDFDSANNIAALKRVDGVIRKNIPLFEHNLVAFPEDLIPKHREDGRIEKWAIDDVGNKTFVNILLRDSMVSISPYYPISYKKVEILQSDILAKDGKIGVLESNNNNLQSENIGLKAKISNQTRDINSQKITIAQQIDLINGQKSAISTLEADKARMERELLTVSSQIETLNEELEKAKNSCDDETLQKCIVALESIAQKRGYTDQLINAIRPRLKRAEDNIEQIGNQLNRKKTVGLTSAHFQLGALVVVALIAIAGILLPNKTNNAGVANYPSTTDVKSMIDVSLQPIRETISSISDQVDDMANVGYHSNGQLYDFKFDHNHFNTYLDAINRWDAYKVDHIAIMEADTFICNNIYKLRAKSGGNNLIKGGGEFWIIYNGQEQLLVSGDNGKTASVSIPEDWDGTCKLVYRFYGMNVKDRDVIITKR